MRQIASPRPVYMEAFVLGQDVRCPCCSKKLAELREIAEGRQAICIKAHAGAIVCLDVAHPAYHECLDLLRRQAASIARVEESLERVARVLSAA